MLQNLKNNHKKFLLLFLIIFCGLFFSKNSFAQSLPRENLEFYSKNNILYYNPLGSLDCANSSAGLLSGDSIEEKIWNYFVNAKIPGVSNNAAVIAGIMGNLYVESGYDPFIRNNIGYSGIYQTEFGNIKNLVEEKYGNTYWYIGDVGNIDRYPEDITVGAIIIELDQLTKKNTRFSKDFVNNLDQVTHNSGKEGASSYAELFLVNIERAVGGSDYLTDTKVQNFVNTKLYPGIPRYQNGPYQGAKKRSQEAQRIFEQYASSTVGSSGASLKGDCYYTSTDNFTYYDQYDPKWSGLRFGSGGINGSSGNTIGAAGCGPTSFAMLATALLGRDILPSETADIAGKAGMYMDGVGSSWDLTKTLANSYSLDYEHINVSGLNTDQVIEKINEYLKNGWMIHTSGSGSSPFTTGGHYIGIRGLTKDGKWLIADSNDKQGQKEGKNNTYKEWDPKEIITNGMALENLNTIQASSISTCGKISNCSGAIVSGGLTEEQAKRLAQYYKLDSSTAGYIMPAGTKWNCVSFSAFFLQKFTSIGKQNSITWGNGKDTAQYAHNNFNLPLGSTPRPFSIFSITAGRTVCSDGHLCGHTGVVVAVNGNDVMTVEASYGSIGYTEVRHHDLSYFKNTKYTDNFAYTDNIINMQELSKVIGE